MNKLDELAIKYGTDKYGKHNYTSHYFSLFNKERLNIRKMIEIGVGEGAGLRMWNDFFPNALIYGADNETFRLFKEGRMKVFLCDQSDKEDLIALIELVGEDIDIIVDDGSHKPEDQINTCLTLMPLLNKEVVYVIEDVSDASITERLGDYEWGVIECGKRYDDRLIIVRHKHG